MRVILFVLSVAAGLAGFVLLIGARTETGEMQALVLLLIAAVLFAGAGVLDSLVLVREELARVREKLQDTAAKG